MYPYLRLLNISFRHLFRNQFINLDEEISTAFRVYPIDIDTNFHLNNGRFLTMMDLARFDFMGKMGLLKHAIKHKWFPVLGSAQMVYLKSLKCFQAYTIHTRLECWDEKWFVMSQRFESENKIYAHGLVRGLMRNRHGKIPPQDVLKAVGFKDVEPPSPSHTTKLWLEMLDSYKNP